MNKSDRWADERMHVEQLVTEAGRIKTPEARAAAMQAISDFKELFPEHAHTVAAFALILESHPIRR
jgi:hypothetical protein